MARNRTALLRITFSTTALVAMGLVFLPMIGGLISADPEPQPWSLVATINPDVGVTNCCTGQTQYVPMTQYSNPPECLACHKVSRTAFEFQPTFPETGCTR